jgi:hypothetical protein
MVRRLQLAIVLALLVVAFDPSASRPLLAQKPGHDAPALLPLSQQIAVREQWLETRHATLLPMMRRHDITIWMGTTGESETVRTGRSGERGGRLRVG